MKYLDAVLGTPEPPPAPISDPGRGADFLSLTESYRADDPGTRIKILAENRGIPASRYRVIDGQIAYKADDDNWYLSEPDGFWQGAKQFGAQTLAHGEGVAGSLLGATLGTLVAGPFGGAIGAYYGGAGGEASRKIHANLAYGEPQTPQGNLQSIAGAGLWAMGGEGAGHLIGKSITRKAVKDISQFDKAAAQALGTKARQQGIDLTVGEMTNLKSLLNRQALLKDMPYSDDVLNSFLTMRNKQVQGAIYRYLDDISKQPTPHQGFKEGVEAAMGARSNLVAQRSAAAKPHYQAAESTPVDVGDVVASLDDALKTYEGTGIGAALTKVKSGLAGKNTAGGVHGVKLDIDDAISAAQRKGKSAQVRQLTQVKDDLLDVLESQAPDYKLGREAFKAGSKPVNELDKSLVGDVIKQAERAAPDLSPTLFGKRSSPQAVAQARRIISSYDPQAWNAVVRGHIQQTLEDVAESSVGEVGNLGGVFRKRLLGTESKKRMMQNALSKEQWRAMQNLSEVLDATGKAWKGQSTTAQRQVMLQELGDEAGTGVVGNILTPHRIPSRIANRIEQVRLGRYAEQLANVMIDPAGMHKLERQLRLLRRLSPTEDAFYNSLGATLGTLIGNE